MAELFKEEKQEVTHVKENSKDTNKDKNKDTSSDNIVCKEQKQEPTDTKETNTGQMEQANTIQSDTYGKEAQGEQELHTQVPKETQKDTKKSKAKPDNLQDFLRSIEPQKKTIIEKFINSVAYDDFIGYLEEFYSQTRTHIHVNCYKLRAKQDVSFRIANKIYACKEGEIISIAKDAYGNSLLKNQHLERIL